jgi:hypothetical protein
VAAQAVPGEQAGDPPERAQRGHDADLREHERVDAQLGDDGGAERDDALHEVRALDGERAGEHAPAALADDRDLLARVLGEALQAGLQPRAGLLGAADVGADPRAAGVVAVLAQPVGHGRQAAVAGEEARDQQHRAAAAVRHAVAAIDRAAPQVRQLESESRLAPQRRDVRDGGQVRHAQRWGH